MTPLDLEKLRKLEAKASPAPWWQDAVDCEDGHGHYKAYCVGYEHKSILDTSNSDVQLIEQDGGPRYDITGHCDTEFIAEMRNATPKLIATIETLQAALRKAVGMLEHASVSMDWTEEEAAQAQDVWDADVASIRAAISGEGQ